MLWDVWLPTNYTVEGFEDSHILGYPWPSLAILGHPSQTRSFIQARLFACD
jgi:hypothetical protein